MISINYAIVELLFSFKNTGFKFVLANCNLLYVSLKNVDLFSILGCISELLRLA